MTMPLRSSWSKPTPIVYLEERDSKKSVTLLSPQRSTDSAGGRAWRPRSLAARKALTKSTTPRLHKPSPRTKATPPRPRRKTLADLASAMPKGYAPTTTPRRAARKTYSPSRRTVPAGPIVWRSRPKRDPAFTSLSKKRNRTKPKKPAEAKPAEAKPAEAATAAP